MTVGLCTVAAGAVLAAVALGGAIGWSSASGTGRTALPAAPTSPAAPVPTSVPVTVPAAPSSTTTTTSMYQSLVSAVARKVDPSIVDINAYYLASHSSRGAGTGIILSGSGLVVTNNHVIDGESVLMITDVGNSQEYAAKVIGYDPSADVAVLQLQGASKLAAAPISTGAVPKLGQVVVALGNAGGVGGIPSASAGKVLGTDQHITAVNDMTGASESLSGLLNISADVQPGDSGGPVVNQRGKVVAMDTAAASGTLFRSPTSQGYAIPISTVMSVVRQVLSGKETANVHIGPAGYLGILVTTSPTPPTRAGQRTKAARLGAFVLNTLPIGPAHKAGLVGGDTITSIDGHVVTSPADLVRLLVPHNPGQRVAVGWVDSKGRTHTKDIVLGSGPPA